MKLVLTAETPAADDKLYEYAHEQLSRIARQLPRSVRSKASIEAAFIDNPKADFYHRFACRLGLKAPGVRLAFEEATLNLYASVDVAVAQLKAACLDRGLIKPPRRQRLAGVVRRTRQPGKGA